MNIEMVKCPNCQSAVPGHEVFKGQHELPNHTRDGTLCHYHAANRCKMSLQSVECVKWVHLIKSINSDFKMHLLHSQGDARIICARRGEAFAVLHLQANSDHGALQMIIGCETHEVAAYVLAGWQWARSMNAISRATYKSGREQLCTLLQRRQWETKRANRRRITRGAGALLSKVMGGKQ